MFRLCSNIRIDPQDGSGAFTFIGVNSISIKRSVFEMAATAQIKLPLTSVVKQKDGTRTTTDTVKKIKVGDRITIQLGYNKLMNTEFKGYVVKLNFKSSPLEIECEDEFYTLRTRNVTLSGTRKLEEILKQCGLNVAACEKLTITNFAVPNKPVSAVLGKIKDDYSLRIFFDLENKIYAVRDESVMGDRIKYLFGTNVIDEKKLEFHKAEDENIKIKAVCLLRNGTRIEATAGRADGSERTINFYDISSMEELKALAQTELKRYSFDGYRGSITTFLEPFAAPAMVAEITDEKLPERSGNYYIETVETTFGTSGARRNIEIGTKV